MLLEEVRKLLFVADHQQYHIGSYPLLYEGMELLMVQAGVMEKGVMNWSANMICLIPTILIAVIVYFALVIKLKAVTQDELKAMPKGATIVRLAKKIHLL